MTSSTFSHVADIAVIASLTFGFGESAKLAHERGEVIKQKDTEIIGLQKIISEGRRRIAQTTKIDMEEQRKLRMVEETGP